MFFGFYPQPLIDIMEPSTTQLISNIADDLTFVMPSIIDSGVY
jgi:NADH:ubiquinone oxidoreductase subunit 4 (subunit M)